jgi:PTS system nitrogen regulatory IIA component
MPYQNMTLEEFARHVGLDAREVRRLAERGKLPAQKVAGVWRFNRARVTEWLQQEMLTSEIDEPRLRAIEKAMADADPAEQSANLVTELMRTEGIDLQLPARTKSSVLLELVQLADRTGLLWDQPGLLRALQERESLCSTGLPNGTAIPHPRQPMPYVSSEPFICLARLGRGIGFGSPYGGLTDVFFLICCHDDRSHLHVLARLMRMLDEPTMGQVRTLDSAEAVLAALVAREKVVAAQQK